MGVVERVCGWECAGAVKAISMAVRDDYDEWFKETKEWMASSLSHVAERGYRSNAVLSWFLHGDLEAFRMRIGEYLQLCRERIKDDKQFATALRYEQVLYAAAIGDFDLANELCHLVEDEEVHPLPRALFRAVRDFLNCAQPGRSIDECVDYAEAENTQC